ncbi:F0F1 ATP synthase subunit delta [Plectonema cf. radiosum LEGE 06105]|uniref:ATP synthase subunit delta n=1 Tax=Plectonema cf. radiosum LEGE 06105 TaxID=945769 RepID=A0A8J7F2V3_9CYAN|nr:ATP synthase F1 subunit delta [Plectonema radiosum]MBE9211404.1 F0F1 ATP synthase subunit delta [Plectonema cf. radiosum LEGE 06105]
MKSNIANAEISRPYAEALMSVAQSNNVADKFDSDVRSLLNLLQESEALRTFFANPFITAEDKKGVISKILSGDTNPIFRNFLMLLVDRRRIILLEAIAQEYLALLRQLNQIVLASVISAVPLTDEQKQTIKEKVKSIEPNAREVELDSKIDSDIIGGVIIKVGSQVVDSSLRGQLRRLTLSLNS